MSKPVTPEQQAQLEKFKAAARELGCDDDEEALKAALRKVGHHKPVSKADSKRDKKAKKPAFKPKTLS